MDTHMEEYMRMRMSMERMHMGPMSMHVERMYERMGLEERMRMRERMERMDRMEEEFMLMERMRMEERMNKGGRRTLEGDLYNALIAEDTQLVLHLVRRCSNENAMHILTIHGDTVLHVATYSKNVELIMNLLLRLPEDLWELLVTRKNHLGNTVLHEAVTSDQLNDASKLMLEIAPDLLYQCNHLEESILFQAARYGNIGMFDFLAPKFSSSQARVESHRNGNLALSELSPAELEFFNHSKGQPHLWRDDKTTVLHVSILSQHFELAYKIAERYKDVIVGDVTNEHPSDGEVQAKYLSDVKDLDGMTALQLLSCNSLAFKSGREDAFLNRPINYVKSCYSWACRETVQNEEQSWALKLAMILIERDTSWKETSSEVGLTGPQVYRDSFKAASDEQQGRERPSTRSPHQANRNIETPLFLATKSGCAQIVKGILARYPQAVEHVVHEGQNILHVAIKYRQLEIFEHVKQMELPMRRLVRKVDDEGNSILHMAGMAGMKRKNYVPEKMQDPALELQEEMYWFERVKKITPPHFINHRNKMKDTADELFASNIAKLHENAKEWLKRTSEGCSIVAVLIATVAFAAAYTVPGGPNQNTGFPLLLYEPCFVIFIVTDVLSLAFALKAVMTFLSVLASSFQIQDFKHSLPHKCNLGITYLILSVSMITLAFAATIMLMAQNKKTWMKIVLYPIAILPAGLVGLHCFSFYCSLLSIAFKDFTTKARPSLRRIGLNAASFRPRARFDI